MVPVFQGFYAAHKNCRHTIRKLIENDYIGLSRILDLVNMGQRYLGSKGVGERRLEDPLKQLCDLEESVRTMISPTDRWICIVSCHALQGQIYEMHAFGVLGI